MPGSQLAEDQRATACEGCGASEVEGIRWPAEPDCPLPEIEGSNWEIVEKCDTCNRYPDDLSAAARLFSIVRWVPCADGGWHAVGRERLISSD